MSPPPTSGSSASPQQPQVLLGQAHLTAALLPLRLLRTPLSPLLPLRTAAALPPSPSPAAAAATRLGCRSTNRAVVVLPPLKKALPLARIRSSQVEEHPHSGPLLPGYPVVLPHWQSRRASCNGTEKVQGVLLARKRGVEILFDPITCTSSRAAMPARRFQAFLRPLQEHQMRLAGAASGRPRASC